MTSDAPAVDRDEVERFSALADEWWDPKGRLAPLHAMNPARLAFIRDRALAHFGREAGRRRPFEGLSLLDVGCGGGLVCEPMARLGFAATGIDPAEPSIGVAQSHAALQALAIDYRAADVGTLAAEGAAFDVVLCLEVVEHTPDPGAFLLAAAGLMAPGGLMILATLNRTWKSLALAKVTAEYVLRWIPPGTHDWRRFPTPAEIRAWLAGAPLRVEGPFGMALDPLRGRWGLSRDADVNYLMTVAAAT